VHPLVPRFEQALAQFAGGNPALVLMIPLLYEVNLQGRCSEVWLVDCDEEQQLTPESSVTATAAVEARARIKRPSGHWPASVSWPSY